MKGLVKGTATVVLLGVGVTVGTWIERNGSSPGAILQGAVDALSPGMALAQDAEPEVSPVAVRDRPRDAYYPNTEDLKPDEMRVIACGTGMPTTRAAQAAACFLVELGNGDKFFFDIGSGSSERISSL